MSLTRLSQRMALRTLSLASLLGILLIAVSQASAAPTDVSDGGLTWGVKESFRNYIEGPIAQGTITASDGASRNAGGTFDFTPASGRHDLDAGTASLAFTGTVNFTGHSGALDQTFRNIRVELDGDTGVLISDVVSKSLQSGVAVDYPDTPFASLDLTGVSPVESGGGTTWTNIPAILTEEGAPAFAGFYEAGQALDPLTITVGAQTPSATPTASPAPSTPVPTSAAAVATPAAIPSAGGPPASDGVNQAAVTGAFLLLATGAAGLALVVGRRQRTR